MEVVGKFGELVKDLRIGMEKTLRQFCAENDCDPGNHSKLERGMLRPPKEEKLEELAVSLGLKKGSEEWTDFIDLAYAERKEFPHDMSLSDEELVEKLPVLFRTVRGDKLSKEQLDSLAEIIRRA